MEFWIFNGAIWGKIPLLQNPLKKTFEAETEIIIYLQTVLLHHLLLFVLFFSPKEWDFFYPEMIFFSVWFMHKLRQQHSWSSVKKCCEGPWAAADEKLQQKYKSILFYIFIK